MSETFKPGLCVRRGMALGGKHRWRTDRDMFATSSLVRWTLGIIIAILWAAVILSGIYANRWTDPLEAYWNSIGTDGQVTNCNIYEQYPEYTKNTLAGMVNFETSMDKIEQFLWEKC